MGVIMCWVLSPFFLSINVSMAGVLYTMLSCYYKNRFSYQHCLQADLKCMIAWEDFKAVPVCNNPITLCEIRRS